MSTTLKPLEIADFLIEYATKPEAHIPRSLGIAASAELRRQHGEIEGLRAKAEALSKQDGHRSDEEIVQQTEGLARELLSWAHNSDFPDGYKFRDSDNPRAQSCWLMACKAQELLTCTDPENAVSELYGAPEIATPQPLTRPAVPEGSKHGERMAFEADLENRRGLPVNNRRRDDGRYGDQQIQIEWEAWQARAMLAAAPQPEAAQKGGA